MIKLNLGCGKEHFGCYTNVDIDPDNNPDVVADVTTPHQIHYYGFTEPFITDMLSMFGTVQIENTPEGETPAFIVRARK